jgi:DNA-binding transcriptional regulator YiaG
LAVERVARSPITTEVLQARRLPRPAMARAIRLEARVSQTRMARELGVDRVTLARWENGSRTPQGELLGRYVDLLDRLRAEVAS